MPLTLKVNGPAPGASTILKALPDGLTLAELQAKISEATGLAPAAQRLKAGFPPKDVDTAEANASVAVTALGIASGSAITVSAKDGASGAGAASAAGAAASDGPLVKQLVEMGFSAAVARKALEMAHDDVGAALEFCISGVVTEDSLRGPGGAASAAASGSSGPAPPALASGHVMVRRVIDADNSCLFNAIGYLMEKDRKVGAKLRKIIADTVRNRPDVYTEAVLGKPPKEYSEWILDPTQWGGELELFILSQYYGAEIVAIEIKSQHCYVYGEDKNYQRRIYVLYDGVHYDAIAGAAGSASAAENFDKRQFPPGDEESKRQALALAAQLKQNRQYVDLSGDFTIRCMVCNKGLKGQKEAQEHAMATRHQNYAQF